MSTTAAARPLVQVFNADKTVKTQVAIPSVLLAPIRPDIVQFVHTNVRKNRRQAHGVALNAGEQTSAESWGTGRAVSRIPRVPGGGTHRSGQGAFGNMCRGGRMYAPKKTWRKWHRKVSVDQRRYAICSALAASAVPALVMARGHKIDDVPEVPLVVANDAVNNLAKTKAAASLLASLGAAADLTRVRKSKHLRAGKGKMRNRRYQQALGPLVIYNEKSTLVRAFRNIPGVDLCCVTRLNLLSLAPGGHLGRFVVWTQDAFERLESLYGSTAANSSEKKGYHVPHSCVTNTDLSRIINSIEIQSALRAKKKGTPAAGLKANPLKNLAARVKLDPYTVQRRRLALLQAAKAKDSRIEKLRAARKTHNRTKKINKAFKESLLS
eukprot:TRINITY_DN1037_c0_g2_i1.p1 TRINITY_DN1037_c0_g2~~TRINITY_DN1037_c0_g2_i1.p1  ORF type:complete len:419 (-),score=229.76 TRINITY_DN1037_c0_g2_i1:55-1197(-)